MATYIENKLYTVNEDDNKHYIRIDALYGSEQSSTFFNADGEKLTVTNQNKDGYLGKGSQLKGKTITIRTKASPDIDDQGIDRIGIVYYVDDQVSITEIHRYDEEEDKDPYPFIKLKIIFS